MKVQISISGAVFRALAACLRRALLRRPLLA